MRTIICCAVILLAAQHLAVAADPAAGWRGQKVMPTSGAVVVTGDGAIQLKSLGILPWVVQDTKGEWLMVGENHRGWVKQSDVVLLDDAIAYYTQEINSGNTSVFGYRASAFSLKGSPDLAIADFSEMLRQNPDASVYTSRGHVWSVKRDYEKAISDFNEAIRLDPNYSTAYNNLAWIRATSSIDKYRDGNEAVKLATKACQMTDWKSSYFCGTLAAAYAETGDFDSAIKYQVQAIELNQHDADYVKRAKERIALFKDQKPHREK